MSDETTFVEGRSPVTAKRLLDAAREHGVPVSQVRTTLTGYIVPSVLVSGESAPEEPVEEQPPAPESEQYDPSEHNVDDVEAHLATVDAPERERILAAEKAGRARKTLLALIDSEGEK